MQYGVQRILTTQAERKRFLKHVKPFSERRNGGFVYYGLRASTEDVILEPVYPYISNFVGDFAAFMAPDGKFGVIGRDGKVVVPAKYEHVEVLPRARAKVTYASGIEKNISLS